MHLRGGSRVGEEEARMGETQAVSSSQWEEEVPGSKPNTPGSPFSLWQLGRVTESPLSPPSPTTSGLEPVVP